MSSTSSIFPRSPAMTDINNSREWPAATPQAKPIYRCNADFKTNVVYKSVCDEWFDDSEWFDSSRGEWFDPSAPRPWFDKPVPHCCHE